jgi:hypothetical protein
MPYKNSIFKKSEMLFTLLGLFLLFGCGSGGTGGGSVTTTSITKAKVSGYVQKGPYLNGTSVTIYELDANLNQTGKTFNTQISNNYGSFELSNVSFASQFVELKADGYYFNEVTGSNSASPITLYALVDLTDKSTINVNLLTHLERERVKSLIAKGAVFSDAKKQAQKELLQLFNITNDTITASETLDLSKDGEDNGILLAVSAILQGNRTEAELSELLANMISDIKQNGTFISSTSGSALINAAKTLDTTKIRINLQDKYTALGVIAAVPDCANYITNFINSTIYQPTETITYPADGPSGINVLDKDATIYPIITPVSMAATLPTGYTLKVKVSGESDNWGYAPFESNGWQRTEYDFATHSRIFTSNTTGSINLKLMLMGGKVTFDVYENGSVVPSWTKTVTPG